MGPVCHSGAPGPGQFTSSTAARQLDLDFLAEQAPATADRDGGRRARAARERFADAALVHAQTDAPLALALHETDVDAAAGSSRAAASAGPSSSTGAFATESTGMHGVRIAHRDGTELDRRDPQPRADSGPLCSAARTAARPGESSARRDRR